MDTHFIDHARNELFEIEFRLQDDRKAAFFLPPIISVIGFAAVWASSMFLDNDFERLPRTILVVGVLWTALWGIAIYCTFLLSWVRAKIKDWDVLEAQYEKLNEETGTE